MTNPARIRFAGRCLSVASLLFASHAFGGYVYDLSRTDHSKKDSEKSSTEVAIEGSKIKMTGFGMDKSAFIYDGENATMLIVNHDDKTYTQLDKQTIEQLSSQISDAMAKMEEQLAKMPPAQRQMMENMMKGKMPEGGVKLPEFTVKRTGDEDTISGYDAEKIEVLSDDGERRELWVASWDELKGSEEFSEALQGMSKLFNEMMTAFSQGPLSQMFQNQQSGNWFDQLHKLEGFPVLTREFNEAGKLVSETVLANVDERDIPDDEFQAPKGYKRQKIGM